MTSRRGKKNKQARKAQARTGLQSPTQRRHYGILSDRRAAAATTLAEAVPGHEAGVPVVWVYRVATAEGTFGFPVPLPSELLLHAGERELERAMKLRGMLFTTAAELPTGERSMQNHQLVFEFFESATVGVAMVFAALSNFVNEYIPREFVFKHENKEYDRDGIIATFGIQMRLSRILAQATGAPNLRTTNARVWNALMDLKDLRDDVEHADGGHHGYKPNEDENTIFGRLLNERDLHTYATHVRNVIDLYRPREQAKD